MDKDVLKKLIAEGLSIAEIAKQAGKSKGSIQYWLRQHKLKTLNPQHNIKEKKCRICGETDPKKFQYRRPSMCKACRGKYRGFHHRRNKLRAIEYKGGKCVECGYHKCPGALSFHHRDPNKKDPNWPNMRSWEFSRILTELDECDLLCRNCHAEAHWDEREHKFDQVF